MRTSSLFVLVIAAGVLVWSHPAVVAKAAGAASNDSVGAATGQSSGGEPAATAGDELPQNFWQILRASGPVGLLIVLLSIAAVALVVEHIMTIRQPVLMPPGLDEEVRELLAAGKVAAASERCRMEPSFLAHVLGAGLAEVDGGWPEVEKAMEDATAEESARLFRKIEYLSVIGNIAPMLGLLGTVIGILMAFKKVASLGVTAQAADLAGGIYLALVTTVEGLIVAIPALGAFAVFRNRVDQLVAEASSAAVQVFAPLKRRRPSGPPKMPGLPKAPPPPPAGGGKS